jgi:glyoxylase-like metal-dependent hydrolase (beta-lactamase superfamily II)
VYFRDAELLASIYFSLPVENSASEVIWRLHSRVRLEPVGIDQPLTAGGILPIAGGIEVVHTPGHCAGQVALLWHPGRMLFAGDVCMNIMGLGDPLGFESLEEGRASQRKLASLSFDAAGFGHGEPIAHDASTLFRNKYGKHPEDVYQQRSAA